MKRKRGYRKTRICFVFVLIFVVLFESVAAEMPVARAEVVQVRSLGKDKLSTIARYFLNGSELFDNYIFDTHNIDNYYAALINGGFDTSGLNHETLTKSTASQYLSSANADNDLTDNQLSDDIAVFRKVLLEERDVYSEDGEVIKVPVYEILGWDIDDSSTWKGVEIMDGDITSIALPSVCLGGILDLSGLGKLESLKCIYTGFEEIKLDGCKSLRELVLCDNAITSIDLRDLNKLETVNVSDNELKNIYWGSYDFLTRFNCTGNYLDTDTDEELLTVIAALKEKGNNPSYKYQRYDENAEFSSADTAFVKEFLSYGENEKMTGWDPDDMSTWSGIQWKTVGGTNYINRIDIARKGLSGELVLSDLKYVREVVCGGNKFTSIDVSGCSTLEQLSCFGGELETLILGGNDKLLYLDCRNNCLVVEDIEAACKEIASQKGSEVYYERQYINAGREAFCENECVELEKFAVLSENKEILKWDFDRPGRIPEILWEVREGEYHVKEIDLSGYEVEGILDLSDFSNMESANFAGTKIRGITLPEHLKELSDNTFMNCKELTEVKLPSELKRIGKTVFYNCEKLKHIDFPDGLEEIQDEAFTHCKSITEITFGKGLEVLGNHAFAGCTSLAKVTFRGIAPGLLGKDVFYNVPEEFAIYYDPTYSGWTEEYWSKYRLVSIGDIAVLPSETGKPSPLPEGSSEPGNSGMPPVSEENGSTESVSPLPSDDMPTIHQEEISGDSGNVHGKKVRVNKPKIKKCKLKKQVLRITIKKDKKVSGYEVLYRKGKKGKFKRKNLKGWKKNQITLRGLKKNSCYYIKARAYKIIGGKKYYSGFTKIRRIKVK
ncbi:MAG: leucine-rich repeat protein [Roseburia sp.]|nr:leucine-rich repeat protein [Roseburia sp.]